MRARTFLLAGLLALGGALAIRGAPAASLPGAPPAPGDSTAWTAPAFTRLDSLFLAAATGEPRLQAVRDSSAKILVALGDTTLEYLARARLVGQTPRQQHYVERLFTVISDSGRNAGPRRVLEKALKVSSDTVRAQLLYIGSAIGDTLFREVAIEWFNANPSRLVRRQALRSIGMYRKPSDPGSLLAILPATEGVERHQVLWALDQHPPLAEFRRLAPYLRDPYFFNRQKTRDLLLKAADSSWAALEPLMPTSPDADERREWRLLARAAKGGERFLRGEVLTREEKVFFGVGR